MQKVRLKSKKLKISPCIPQAVRPDLNIIENVWSILGRSIINERLRAGYSNLEEEIVE